MEDVELGMRKQSCDREGAGKERGIGNAEFGNPAATVGLGGPSL